MIELFRKRFLMKEKGQALVEMALVIPILLLFFMGIFEFGRIFGSYMIINNLARDGVRYGVVGYNDTQIEDLIKSNVAWLDENKMNIAITPSYTQRKKGEPLEVKIDYTVPIIVPLIANIISDDGTVKLTTNYIMRIEH